MKDTDLIKQKLDIVDLVGEYVQLKPSGINHKGLCPFHQEKSPSFMVNRERQSWHCFGCNKGGDMFSFVQEIEGMEFREALKLLAQKAGVELTNTVGDKETASQKTRIKEINAKAAAFYHHILTNIDAAEPARAYLRQRGLTDDTIREWQIGFIPDQWELLTKYILKKGYSIDDLIAAGLTIKKDTADIKRGKGFYDRFRGRIMFPIWDVHGNVVGFTGRVLVETEKSGGKYVNTPQTPVYDKSSVVFGLNKAKQPIRTAKMTVLVEGQMDVIACHQAGMKNVVATSGTALTTEQIALLKRYADTIHMAFDADEAGIKAAKRGIDLAIEAGMQVKVIQIPEGKGKDPDECIKAHPEVWFHAVEQASPVMDWYFARTLGGKQLSDPREKQEVANILLAEIIRIPQSVERHHWLQKLAGVLGIDVSVLQEDAQTVAKQQKHAQPTRVREQVPEATVSQKKSTQLTREEKLFERLLIGILTTKLWIALSDVQERLLETLSGSKLYPLYEKLKVAYTPHESIDVDSIRGLFDTVGEENLVDVLLLKASIVFEHSTPAEVDSEVQGTLHALIDVLKHARIRALESRLRQAEAAHETAAMQQILEEVQALHALS